MNWGEFKEIICKNNIGYDGDGYMYAAFTDKIMLCKWDNGKLGEDREEECAENFDKFLEIRVFDKTQEYRLFRPNIGRQTKIYSRYINDADNNTEYGDYFDEKQFIDIDSDSRKSIAKGDYAIVTSTGGGRYELPCSYNNANDYKIVIRNYIKYYEKSGQAYVSDWRMVGFEEVEVTV